MGISSILDPSFYQQNRNLLFCAVFIVAFPILTFQITSYLFFRTARSSSSLKTPPTIPYWIPGIFHGVGLAFGTPAYFGKLIKEYGDHSPFVVKAGTLSFLITRDATHVKKILESPKQLTPTSLNIRIYDKAMGSPKEALPLYKGEGEGCEDISNAHLSLPRQYLSGPPLIPLADIYAATFSRNMNSKMFQTTSWTEIEDLWSFFQNDITKATIETLFGSAIFKQYPKLVKDFWEFDNSIENFTKGLPRSVIPSAYTARDRLHEHLKKWLKLTDDVKEAKKLAEQTPAWDTKMGSQFFQARDDACKRAGMNYEARAAEALALLHESNSDNTPSTFWYIVETLRNPILTKHITKKLRKHYIPATSTIDMSSITALPLIQSMHAEIGRLRLATVTVRTNEVDDFKLGDQWVLPKGMSVILFSHDFALNRELWENARRRTTERPLEEFWAERFLVPAEPARDVKTTRKETIGEGKFSMEDLEFLHNTYGSASSGSYPDPGRYLARAIQSATLAVLLCEFEIELSDPDDVEWAIPPIRELAYGTVKPLGKVRLRIRKRHN
ncbi:putative cytochrome-like protein P450 [Pleomassaria siparia CBS 279.74]|uniref:Putative cytochrome-like protein P450 n=1 Tax=Pleomassaria siparia CBS 279.74 TaxID=1314801 RepID=A0A6G1KCL5_9PLEO|nr:putative cytochrome-like protein P450 [Pleomassaria siparia CBS 279.74]